MKDLGEIKTIIGWQITRNLVVHTMKIDQLVFIRDLVIEKGLTDCNANVILMQASSAIEMTDPKDYEGTKLQEYQCLIDKLIYLAYGIRSDIAFIVGQLSKHNANLRKGHLQAIKE